jgi:hypothetical protein
VSDTGFFARAAERRDLTQSASTRRIRAIEDSLGGPFFDRNRWSGSVFQDRFAACLKRFAKRSAPLNRCTRSAFG